MTGLSTLDFLARLGAGAGCGALIGLERQSRSRTAGLRTNALVATGATLFVEYSEAAGAANGTQVAAYVVSGVGFLGGGVILRDGYNVSGLNTAATLWCSAALGVLAASGHLGFAAIATAAVLLIHLLGRPLGRLIDPDNPAEQSEGLLPYQVQVTGTPKNEARIRALIVAQTSGAEVILTGLETTHTDDGRTVLAAHVLLDGQAPARLEQLVSRLSLEPGIHAVRWHTDEGFQSRPESTAR
jgi:putative Mg2+ transporter-C (MgtC) family protein